MTVETTKRSATIVSNDLVFAQDVGKILKANGYSVNSFTDVEQAKDQRDLDCLILDRPFSKNLKTLVCEFNETFLNCHILVCCHSRDLKASSEVLSFLNVDTIRKPISQIELELRLMRMNLHQRAIRELEDSSQFIRQISDLNPELIYLFDPETGNTEYLNQSLRETVGCGPIGLKPKDKLYFYSLMDPEKRNDICELLRRQWSYNPYGDYVHTKYRIKVSNGKWRWIHTRETWFRSEIEGVPDQILGVAQDITDTHALNETASWMAAIVNSSEEAIIGKTLDGKIVSWNAAAELLYGYSLEEVIGQNISVLLPDDHRDDVAEIMQSIRRREKTERYQTRRRHKDGNILKVSLNISPVIDANNNLLGASTIAHSVLS